MLYVYHSPHSLRGKSTKHFVHNYTVCACMYVCLCVQSAGLGLGDELEQVNPHCAIADQLEVDGLTEKEREEFGYVWREVCAC